MQLVGTVEKLYRLGDQDPGLKPVLEDFGITFEDYLKRINSSGFVVTLDEPYILDNGMGIVGFGIPDTYPDKDKLRTEQRVVVNKFCNVGGKNVVVSMAAIGIGNLREFPQPHN